MREVVSFGPFRLNLVERALEREGVAVPLGGRAMDVLIRLVERPGELVDRRELMASVWPNVLVEEGNLRLQVTLLRKALADGHQGARYITNIPRRGYAFVAPVSHDVESVPRPSAEIAREDGRRLPPLPPRLVGRDALIQDLSLLLETQRLTTLVGPGGIGKTTVATAVAHGQLSSFDGAVLFVDFGRINDKALVTSALAAALGLRIPSADPIPILPPLLQRRRMLLVLDSCEHVIENVAEIAERIVQETPAVHILATSREPLRVAGEQIHRVEPLVGPPIGVALTAAQVLDYPAGQLFVARVRESCQDFELRDIDAPMVAEICRRLEGIALAIEIVAGRVEAYGIQKTGDLLSTQFELLWRGRRTAIARHQTMSAAIEWSFNLLPDTERIVLRRLAVFSGPFTLEAAQRVVTDHLLDEKAATEIVANLVDKSLIATEVSANGMRYRLFDTTQAYLLPKLVESGEVGSVQERHARYWLDLLELIDADAPTQGSEAFANFAVFLSDIRSALDWCFSATGDPRLGAALVAVAAPLLLELSFVNECYEWTKRGIAELPDSARDSLQEMKLLAGLGLSSMVSRGNADEVQTSLTRGLNIAMHLREPYHALRFLGPIHLSMIRAGDFRGSLAAAKRCEEFARQTADPVARMMAQSMVGSVHHSLGNISESQQYCEASLAEPPTLHHAHMAYLGVDHRNRALCVSARNLWVLGLGDQAIEAANFTIDEGGVVEHPVSLGVAFWTIPVYIWAGDYQRAEEAIERLLARAAKFSLKPYLAMSLGQRGGLAVRQGDPKGGVKMLEEALRIANSSGYTMIVTQYMVNLAEGLLALGRIAQALALIDRAIVRIEASGELLHMPELLRLKGEALAQTGADKAQEALYASLQCARSQDALAWELRAASSLARLRTSRGCKEGTDLLSGVFSRFREGFGTVDLRAAASLAVSGCPGGHFDGAGQG